MDFETLKKIVINSIDEAKTPVDLFQIIINKVYEKGVEDEKNRHEKAKYGRFCDIDSWFRLEMNKPIEVPQQYIDGWNAGKRCQPYDDTKSITWKCGYDDGKYDFQSSLLF